MEIIDSIVKYTVNGKEAEPQKAKSTHAHAIVSKVGYMLGLPKRLFELDESFRLATYETLDNDTRSRIIRNLCMLRTAIERHYGEINDNILFKYKSLTSLPDLVPQECITELAEDRINIISSHYSLNQIIIEINRTITDRINNCKDMFPIWLNWEYLRSVFIMPNGLTETGIREAAAVYYEHKAWYPYQIYLNWRPSDEGNILYNDEKFVKLLYQWNDDEFTDYSKVQDVGSHTKDNIYSFLEESGKTVFVVDCENSDPYKLCATLQNLQPSMLEKVSKIILYDDIHSAAAWDILKAYTSVPVEHTMIERVKQDKSLVDIRLTAGTCREFYINNVDSFILVSSDSDYWGLITSMPEAHFLVMAEYEKCSPAIKSSLIERGIFYCFIDNFYSGNNDDIKITALIREANKFLAQAIHVNLDELMNRVTLATRASLNDDERKRFRSQYLNNMQMETDADGNISLKIIRKK